MTVRDEPSAHDDGTHASTATVPRIDRADDLIGYTHAANGDVPADANGGWQAELARRLRFRAGRGVLAGLVLGVLIGLPAGALSAQGTTTYTSNTVMLLDDPVGIAIAGDANTLIKVDDLRYKYASLASTYAIAAPVADDLHVPVSVVLGSTSVQVPTNSLLMVVTGTGSTPGIAKELSGAMAQGVAQYIQNENTTYKIPATDQVVARVVSPTSVAVASHPSRTHALGVGVVVFVVGAAVGFLAFQLLASEPARRRRR
jgi:capsular polysaccharide biosynthesis protein